MSPWERRERGGLYYTRSRKEGGRVVREYVGSGVLGELAAQIDAEARRRREEEEASLREERERLDALTAPVEELCEAAEIIASVMVELGHASDEASPEALIECLTSEPATPPASLCVLLSVLTARAGLCGGLRRTPLLGSS